MQIHELDNFTGSLDNAFFAVDDGTDTGKTTKTKIVKEVNDEIDLANARIDNLISGVTVNSEVIDARVGDDGNTYATLGGAIRTQVKHLHELEKINTVQENLLKGFKQGYYAASNGAYESNHNNYVCSTEAMPFNYGDIISYPDMPASGATTLYLNFFDSDMNYIKSLSRGSTSIAYNTKEDAALSDLGFVHISLLKQPTVSPETAPMFNIYKTSIFHPNEYLLNFLKANAVYPHLWSNYIVNWDSFNIAYAWNRIGILTPIVARADIRITAKSGYKYAVFRMSSTVIDISNRLSNTGWITDDHIVKKGEIFIVNMAKSDDSSILPQDGYDNLTIYSIADDNDLTTNYVLAADMIKKRISTKRVGTLSYDQSFCTYNGNWYSINGSKIAEQDSDFNVLRDVSLSTGHGNALQLGNSNIAYASGWNDNKVYAVDLDNLTIDSVITLPTTGYTTCAVDDLNGIVYIFQRDSYPDHEDNYKFIVYDYVNDQIKSERVINSFGAMQAADIYNGKIVITWGLGTVAVPSGMAMYNTAGDMLAEYKLSIFASSEPEGVCIDRDTKELYIGIGVALYKIS